MSNKPETPAVASPYKPANLDAHEADKAARQAVRDKNRQRLMNCLDPEYASRQEARKPVFEWKVECSYMKPQEKGGLRRTVLTEQVVAKDEVEAWAVFCDKFDLMVSRKACDVKIEKLKQRTADGDAS